MRKENNKINWFYIFSDFKSGYLIFFFTRYQKYLNQQIIFWVLNNKTISRKLECDFKFQIPNEKTYIRLKLCWYFSVCKRKEKSRRFWSLFQSSWLDYRQKNRNKKERIKERTWSSRRIFGLYGKSYNWRFHCWLSFHQTKFHHSSYRRNWYKFQCGWNSIVHVG